MMGQFLDVCDYVAFQAFARMMILVTIVYTAFCSYSSRSEVLVLEHVDTIREYTEVCVAEASSGGQDSLKVAVAAILQLVREQGMSS